jgi:hypothetical protein
MKPSVVARGRGALARKEESMESTHQREGSLSASLEWLERGSVLLHPVNVEEALRSLDAVAARLTADGDARAVFPDIYAIITRRVAEHVETSRQKPGPAAFFLEPAWISRLAARFCERYLETLRLSLSGLPQDADAWELAYEARADLGTLPLQHVLLGLSAHINYDLAIGIHRTILERGAVDGATLRRYRHDHDAVNDLLRASIPEAFDHLVNRHRCEASGVIYHRTYAFAEWAIMRVLSSWRARVWDDALALLAAGESPARLVVVQRMHRLSRRYARVLALPGTVAALHKPDSRDARHTPGNTPGAGGSLWALL